VQRRDVQGNGKDWDPVGQLRRGRGKNDSIVNQQALATHYIAYVSVVALHLLSSVDGKSKLVLMCFPLRCLLPRAV